MGKFDSRRQQLGGGEMRESPFAKRKAQITPLSSSNRSALDVEQSDMEQMEMSRQISRELPEQPDLADSLARKQTSNGKSLPVIGPILRGLDAFSENEVVEDYIAAPMRSLYTPGAGLGNMRLASEAAEGLISRVAPKLATTGGGRAAQTAIREAAVGFPVATGTALTSQTNDLGEAFKAGAVGAAAGAALGGGASLAGSAFRNTRLGQLFNDYLGRNTAAPAPESDLLALPGPEARLALPSPKLALPSPNVLRPTTARAERAVNPYRVKLETLFDEANRLQREGQFMPGREREHLDDLWSRMAASDDPALDDLIDLAYPQRVNKITPDLVQRAKTYQNAREVAGVPLPVRTSLDRYPSGVTGQAAAPRMRLAGGVNDGSKLRSTIEQTEPSLLKSSPEPQSVDDLITVKEPRVRDKVYTLLDDAEKAARERIKSRGTRLNSLPLDEFADHAIILAAKMGKGTIRLADATEYLVREFGEEVRPHAQRIYNTARNYISEAERRANKQAQEARAFNAQDIGDANTFRQNISRGKIKDTTPFRKKIERIRTTFVDDIAPLESLEKGIRGKVSSAENSVYKSARLFKGMPAKANRIVVDRLTPVIERVEKAGFNSNDLGDYALAIHARDVNALDIKSGWTNREISEVIKKFGTAEMEAARKELIKIGDDMLIELADSGVISRELVSALRKKYPNYVPLFRAMDDEKVEFGRGVSNALANVTAPIKGLKGSDKQVIDPLENMVKNIFQSVSAAERNKVARQLGQLVKDDKKGNFIRKLTDDEAVGRKNVVSVLENGEKVRYEVEPEVYKAMLNLDQEASNMLIKVLQAPASILRAGATLTPEFSLRNPMRDVIQAYVVSNSGFNPLIDFPVGLIQSVNKGDLYKQWVRDMGDFGNIVSMDRNTHQEALKQVLGEPTSKKFVNILTGKSLIGVLRAIADTTESATKVGEYRAALRQGQTRQEAAYRARDIMDFARAGSGIRQPNKIIAFLNANIQGKSKLIRAVKENPAGVTARAFTTVTLPTIAIYGMQKYWANEEQKRIIDESPDWLRNSFWLVPIPGTDQVGRIPKPFDLAALFSNLPERAMKYVFDNDKAAFDKFFKQSMSDAALPTQISGLLPFVEGMANYSFFRQGEIIPRGEQGREFKDQYDIDTTETGKFLAATANKLTGGEGALKNFSSPRIMDNTIRGLTAGLGTYATSAIDVILDEAGITDNPVKPTRDTAQRPLAKAFLVNPLQSGKSTEKLYDMKDKLSKEKSSTKLAGSKFDPAKEKLLKSIEKQTDNMSDLTKKIRETENSRTLSSEEKGRIIKELTQKRNQIAHEAAKKIQ